MTGLGALIKRNCKLFFKDKGMFFSALITPIILLVLFVSFLGKVYYDSFSAGMPEGLPVNEKIINAIVGGELVSSLLAVCCVTVAFCSGLLMINDKVNSSVRDLTMTPLKRSALAFSYFSSTALSTLLICTVAAVIGLFYILKKGWYLSFGDVVLVFLDVILLTLFGTALSSIVCFPLKTSGQASAVGTLVSSGYGFLCGAYMPISTFSKGLQTVLSFLPGTYGTSLIRNHLLQGVFREMKSSEIPSEVIENLKDSIDCNLYFLGNKIEISTMYIVLGGTVLLLIGLYILINVLARKKSF